MFFGIFDSPSSLLWRHLKPLLEKYLIGATAPVISNFKQLLTTTRNDLVDCLKDSSLLLNSAEDELHYSKSEPYSQAIATYSTLPLSHFAESPALVAEVEAKLKKNVSLNAARNSLSIPNDEWNALVKEYAAAFVKYGAGWAFEHMIKEDILIGSDYTVVAVSKKEAYSVGGNANFHDMVKFYSPPYQPKISPAQARRLWHKRHKSAYRYVQGEIR